MLARRLNKLYLEGYLYILGSFFHKVTQLTNKCIDIYGVLARRMLYKISRLGYYRA